VFLSKNYRLIVATRKFDVLKTNIAREAKLILSVCMRSIRGLVSPDSPQMNNMEKIVVKYNTFSYVTRDSRIPLIDEGNFCLEA